jgi:hypothetical protein
MSGTHFPYSPSGSFLLMCVKRDFRYEEERVENQMAVVKLWLVLGFEKRWMYEKTVIFPY